MKTLQDAQWIFVNGTVGEICNSYYDYKSEFQANAGEKTILYLSVCSLYAVYINGQFVDCGQYPGYEDYQVYDSLDITRFIIEGTNTLFITQYVMGKDFATHRDLIPGVIFAIWQKNSCVLKSTTDCMSRVNPYYENGEMEHVSPQLGYVFRYDARKEETPFCTSVLAKKEKMLYERPIKKLPIDKDVVGKIKNQGVFRECKANKAIGKRMQDSYMAGRTEKELLVCEQDKIQWNAEDESEADGVYFIFDAREETVGFLSLDVEVPEECEVLIGYGEHLEDLRVRSFIENRNFCCSYHAKKGRNQFFYPFQRVGMRYLQIHIYSKNGILYHAGIQKTYYPLKIKECLVQDGLYQKIYEVGIRTLQLCMHEHYEDCPWREQALYSYDSRIQMLCGYYAFEEHEFAKASLRLMARALRKDSMIELCAPGRVPITIPSFTVVFVRQVKEYLEYSGDTAFIQEVFGTLSEIVEALERRIVKYDLLPYFEGEEYWNFYEWSEGMYGRQYFYDDARYEAPLNALVSDAFHCYAQICDVVCSEKAEHYNELHRRMNSAIHQHFYDKKRKVYVTHKGEGEDSVVHAYTQALMLYVQVVPEGEKEDVVANLIRGDVVPCALSSSIFLYDALLKQGGRYRNYVRREVERRWGAMLFAGATTFWETDKGHLDFRNAGSLCHGWSAVPIYLQMKYQLWQ